MQTLGTYPGNETIADHVGGATYRKLTHYLQKQGLPAAMFMKMKPGLIAMTLSVFQIQKLGYSPDLGVDRHFLGRANKDKKEILELETIDQQLELMLNFADDELMLKHTMSQVDKMEEEIANMIDAWKKGDAVKLEKIMLDDPVKESPDYKTLIDRLITDRNHTMTDKIKAYLKEKKNYFVIVGAGHLVGDEGIVSLLQKNGFVVSQM